MLLVVLTPTVQAVADAEVLLRFRLDPSALIGEGGESRVYALGEERVLRVLPGAPPEERLRRILEVDRFLAPARSRGVLPYALPEVLDGGTIGDATFTVERRMRGTSLDRVLPALRGERRALALERYADAVPHLARIPVPDDPRFGGFWDDQPSWPATLLSRVTASVEQAGAPLREDLPSLDAIVGRFEDDLALVADTRAPLFVHGDLFPGNVMVSEDLEVTGVLDVGDLALFGDPRLDASLAAAYLGIRDPMPGDVERVRARLPVPPAIAGLYERYGALRFCFTRTLSPKLYAWCLAILRP